MEPIATAADPTIITGVLLDQKDGLIVLGINGNSDYRLHLVVDQPLNAKKGDKVRGRIRAKARRVDLTIKGGKFVEPLYGRPRRVQGRIRAADDQANTIVIDPAGPFVCELTLGPRPSDLPLGPLVGFEVLPGARFEPV